MPTHGDRMADLHAWALNKARTPILSPENNAILQRTAAAAAMAFAPHIAGTLAFESGFRCPPAKSMANKVVRPFMRDKIRQYTTRPYRKYGNSRYRRWNSRSHCYPRRMPYRRGFKRRYGRRTRYRRSRGNYGRRRRYNKSRARRYSRIGRMNGRLRGLQGPNCVPSTCYCKLKTKFAGDIIPVTTANPNVILTLASHNMAERLATDASVNGIFTTGTAGMLNVGDFTTPAIFPVLQDMFQFVRCVRVSVDVKIMFIPTATNNNDTRFGVFAKLGAHEVNIVSAFPATTDQFSHALLSRTATIKNIPFPWGAGGNDSPGHRGSAFTRIRKSWSPINLVPDISNSRDYFNDEKHANEITGAIGSRTINDIPNGDDVRCTLQLFDSEFGTLQVQATDVPNFMKILIWGTITHHTSWSRPNPTFNFTDTQL